MYEEFDDYDLKQKIDYSLWGKIFKYLKPFWKVAVLAAVFIAVLSTLETLFSFFIAQIGIGEILEKGNHDKLPGFIALLLVIVLLEGVCCYGFIVASARVDLYYYRHLSTKTFDKLQELPFAFYDNSNVGWLIARVTSDTQRLSEIVSWGMIDIVWAVFKLISVLTIMIVIEFRIALIMMFIVPFILVIGIAYRRLLIAWSRKVRRLNSKITGALNEGISGAKTSKSLVLEKKNSNEFAELTQKYKKTSVISMMVNSSYYQIIAISTGLALALTAYFGGWEVLKGGLFTVSTLYLFVSNTTSFFEPVLNVARLSNDMKHAQVAAERVFNLIAMESSIVDTPEVIEKYGDNVNLKKENWEHLAGDVEFSNVTFQYSSKGPLILQEFNLKVKEGQSVAIVGETGAGKSTIINLLCRFYEPTSGEVLIDGKNYKERSIAWLHSNLGYVLQSPQLFSGSIMENVRYGKLDATDEEVHEACKVVEAHDFIVNLEKGYDTEVGEGGNRLSLGQKQLISFARAIIANPRLLILDEATSSIDTETEYVIKKAIANILKGRTSFLIAHRLSTIVNSDLILVLENGKIIEQGNHDTLMANKGHYYNLYTNQFIEEEIKKFNG